VKLRVKPDVAQREVKGKKALSLESSSEAIMVLGNSALVSTRLINTSKG